MQICVLNDLNCLINLILHILIELDGFSDMAKVSIMLVLTSSFVSIFKCIMDGSFFCLTDLSFYCSLRSIGNWLVSTSGLVILYMTAV